MAAASSDADRKIAELERKLREEREKVLLSSLKSQEEKTVAARVENSIKEMQDKLRQQRRESEYEETRLKLEAKVQEMENRLAQERETWVGALKGQMQSREGQDREIESHFTMRIQEMERRWLEEKAHWQRIISAKEEEARRLSSAAERLQGLQSEFDRLTHEKKFTDQRLAETEAVRAELDAKVRGAADREREFYQLKSELERARDQLQMHQAKFEHDIAAMRTSSKEREERLLADNERLQNELLTVSQRVRGEYETELKRQKSEHETELKKSQVQGELATAALQRMRAVGGALERQVASLRMQAEESKKLKEEVQRVNERYKAEFLVLQRKWQDRETEIRKAAEENAAKKFDADKTKLKLLAQEEIQKRVGLLQEQLRKELSAEVVERERAIRAEMERELAERARKTDAELERKGAEAARKETQWQDKLLSRESELLSARSGLDEAKGRLARLEDARSQASREKLEYEKTLAGERERLRVLDSLAAEFKTKLDIEERRGRQLGDEKASLERLKHAYEEQLDGLRGEMEGFKRGLAEADQTRETMRAEGVELQETVARIEAEHARQKETWRRKLDLVRRDAEERIRALEAELESRGGRSLFDRLRALFGSRPRPPLPPPFPPGSDRIE
ncbi:MAG: hypothetical protein A2X36_08750 [Elusimicrobia bacterium GWA2_69_24]|nr:MAG: hypothetical protein A2X36_08750 [Elusimicrobia bacterium GWA2_69_24]HBL15860.1 hypothetical protein [Elusimicrobiota bacterium]